MYHTLLLAGCSPGTRDVDGAIAIRGELPIYHPPRGHGAYPLVEPGEQVRVYCNDQLVTVPTVVFPTDRLRFEVDDLPPEVRVQVELSPDEMTATLVVCRKPGARYRVMDAPPTHALKPRAEVAATIPPRPITLEEVMAALEQAGVCHGVDLASVRRAVEAANQEGAPEQQSFVVAVGDPPRMPRDSRLELAAGLATDALVEPGQLLVRKIPAMPGRPGRTVRGAPVAVPDPRDPPLRAGKGTALAPDGHSVVATRGGRLVVQGWTVWVQSVQQVPGDVTVATSPLRFPGDIVILG